MKLDDGKKKKEEIRLGIKLKDSLFLDNWELYKVYYYIIYVKWLIFIIIVILLGWKFWVNKFFDV